MDIEFFTTPELIDELARRTTFAGIIIRSEKEAKNCDGVTIHQNWDITYSKLTNEQVADLLEDAVAHFRQLAEAENE
jgi:hypothetical protein